MALYTAVLDQRTAFFSRSVSNIVRNTELVRLGHERTFLVASLTPFHIGYHADM